MSDENSALIVKCKRCKSKTVNGYKCQVCSSVFHPSCAKLMNNITFISDDTIICCDILDKVSQDSERDQPIMEDFELSEEENVSFRVFNYIIKQKNIIIKELYSKLELLSDKVRLLENIRVLESQLKTEAVTTNSGASEVKHVNFSSEICNEETRVTDIDGEVEVTNDFEMETSSDVNTSILTTSSAEVNAARKVNISKQDVVGQQW